MPKSTLEPQEAEVVCKRWHCGVVLARYCDR